MTKYAVFSNYGNWDPDLIGFVGFADVDTVDKSQEQIIEIAAKTLHADEMTENGMADASIIPADKLGEVLDEYEAAAIVDVNFDVFGTLASACDHQWDMLIGLIEVR